MEEERGGTGDKLQVVIFRLSGEEYGIPILSVQEIIRPQTPTRIPKAPEFIKGIINLRGQVIPVVSLVERFGLQDVEESEERRIIVVEVEGSTVGIFVDAVSEVMVIGAEQVHPPMESFRSFDARFIEGVVTLDDRLIILIDINKIFAEDELLALEQAKEQHAV